MKNHRTERLQEEIRQAVSSILLFEVTDPLLKGITLNRVLVTKDLGLARIYYEVGKGSNRDIITKALEKARSFIRHQLAGRVNLRLIPAIEFFYDETSEEISRVEGLLKKL